jgi:hypothetical protein
MENAFINSFHSLNGLKYTRQTFTATATATAANPDPDHPYMVTYTGTYTLSLTQGWSTDLFPCVWSSLE